MPNRPPNNLYFKLAGILFIPLVFVVAYALSGHEIGIGPFVLQKADITAYFPCHKRAMTDTLQADSVSLDTVNTVATDTTAQRILLFGDSMVEGLSKRMRNYAAENGHELLNVIWYSSSTKIWAKYDTLSYYIRQFEPTYLMLCLGGNELSVRDLDKREEYIQAIIEEIGDRPYIWIGPPNWKEDTGINRLIEENAGSCRYYPSLYLSFERGRDGAHPTLESAAQWMDSVAVWIAHSSCHRIRMAYPQSDERRGRTVILYPLR